MSLFDSNLQLLRPQQPQLAAALESYSPNFTMQLGEKLETVRSASGDLVPLVNGRPFHSLEDPVREGRDLVASAGFDLIQTRILVFGFAFGYHVVPLVERGFSPLVYEPCFPLLHLAFQTLDLTRIIPFVTFHTGNRPPDIPRNTLVLTFQSSLEAFPREAQIVHGKILDVAAKTADIEEGTRNSAYRNVTCLKNPVDLSIYQMLFWIVRPTLVLEIGTCRGGSALFFADLLRTMGGDRRVHTYDINDEIPIDVINDPAITFHGKGWKEFDPAIIRPTDRVLVIEDSSHTYENTLEVLEHFAPYVAPNSYFIVEDGAAGLIHPRFNGGPVRAIEEFLPRHPEFEIDQRWENYFGPNISNCLKGFLRRKLT